MKQRVKWLEFTSIVKYRVPQYDDGTFGNPQVMNKWTDEPKEQKAETKKPSKQPETPETTEEEEVLL